MAASSSRVERRSAFGPISLVVVCTIIGAAAQILMRHGAAHLHGSTAADLLRNWELIAGYACLAVNTGLLILALRDGELSVLYPIIALTYVWVTILSPMFFGDIINTYKVAGVALIVLGVSFIGLGSRS
jgi:drug/metabolite transporter (DMT)-like permease